MQIFSKNIIKKREKKIKMLSPIEIDLSADNNTMIYIEELDNAINHSDGYNIAVSGSYGTGKSSIFKTYISKKKLKKKSIAISLGSFLKTTPTGETKEDKNGNRKGNDIESEQNGIESGQTEEDTIEKTRIESSTEGDDNYLSDKEEKLFEKVEKSIVKELIYRIKYSNSKLSGISRLQKNWKLKYALFSYFISYILLYLYIHFSNNEMFKNISDSIVELYNRIPVLSNYSYNFFCLIFNYLFLIDLLWIAVHGIYYLFIISNRIKTKVKINNYELELDNSSETGNFSFMDNLYEILYYFMNSNTEIVFFEDMDRYPKDVCIKIIEDLKELNNIINNCDGMNCFLEIFGKKIYGRKKVVFVYSFKDSVFYDYTEKNKFYDKIISIMPISTRYNSDINFINELNDYKLLSNAEKEVVSIAANYINDMRTIKNIVNDYSVFSKMLKEERLNDIDRQQLFALCTYKNYDIKEYDELLKYDNIVDKLIGKFVTVTNEQISETIKKENEQIDRLVKSKNDSKSSLLLNNKINDISSPTEIIIDNDQYTVEDFLADDFNIELFDYDPIYVKIAGSNPQEIKWNEDKDTFVNNIKNCNSEIKRCNNKIKKLQSTRDYSTEFYEFAKEYSKDIISKLLKGGYKEKDKLIINFICHGFIRKNYIDYITSPIGSDYLTSKDARFVFSYKHNILNFDDIVDNPEHILEYLKEESYNNPYIMNNSIVKHIYDVQDKNKELFIQQFVDIKEEHFEFLKQLARNEKELYKKVETDLSENFDSIWNKYVTKFDLKNKDYNEIIVDIALRRELNASKLPNKDKLKSLIYSCSDVSHVYLYGENDERLKILINNLVALDIQFQDISKLLVSNNNNDEIITRIVCHDIFELNRKNIYTIIFKNAHLEYYPLAYNIIKNSKYSAEFEKSIKKHLDTFATGLYLGEDNKNFIIGDEKLIKYIIENSNDKIFIEEILKREKFEINNYTISHEFFKLACTYNHIKINWQTIVDYSVGNKKEDEYLFKTVYGQIDKFYNKNINLIRNISVGFIDELLKKLYKEKKFIITKEILENYDTKKLNKENITNCMSYDEIIQKVENNMIKYSENNLSKIKNICKKEIIDVYIENWLKQGNYDKAKKLLCKEQLDTIKELAPDQKIECINILIEKSEIDAHEIINIVYNNFEVETEYVVKYQNKYQKNIFDHIGKKLKNYKHESRKIIFVLKKRKK